MVDFVPILESGIAQLSDLAQRGGPEDPLKVLAAVQALREHGGKVSLLEVAAVAKALSAAVTSDVLSDEEKKSLLDLLKKLLKVLGGYKYPKPYDKEKAKEYGEKEATGESTEAQDAPIEFIAKMLQADDEAEGLAWPVRVLRSGLTVDKRCEYLPGAVRNSVPLFEGVQCFADHPRQGEVPSVNRLVGWFISPEVKELEEEQVAIHATLNVLESSPMAGLLREIYQRDAKDTLGFSINGHGNTRLESRPGGTVRVVETIDGISSVDLVTKPNAGGKLLELRAAVYEAADLIPEVKLESEPEPEAEPIEAKPAIETPETPPTEPTSTETTIEEAIEPVRAEVEALKHELEAEKLRNEVQELIGKYNLPEAVMSVIEPRLEKVASLEEAKTTLSEVEKIIAVAEEEEADEQVILTDVTDTPDRKIVRLQGLIAGEPIDNVEPYQRLREAFADVTGMSPWDMSPQQYGRTFVRAAQGFDSSLLETVKTGDWSTALGVALHRELIRQYQLPGFDDWKKLVVSPISNLNDMRQRDRIRIGYYDILPTVSEAATYTSLVDPSDETAYYSPSKRGGLADYSWEAALNDDLQALRLIPKRLAMSAKVTIWYNILDIFANATPPTCTYDSVALFHASHNNLAAAALDSTSFGAARKAMMTQTVLDNTYISLGVTPKFLVVPPDLESTAIKLRVSEYDPDTTNVNVANPWRGTFDIVVIPFWSDVDAWAAVADPMMVPTIEVGFLGGKEEPELFTEVENTGSHFTADKITYKVRHVWGFGILDHRGMYKSVPV